MNNRPVVSNARTRSSEEFDPTSAAYFREISAYRVMDPEEEVQLARDIETFDIETWRIILSWPELGPPITEWLIGALPEPPAELTRLLRAFRRRGASSASIARAAAAAAPAARAADLDKEHLRAVLTRVERHIGQPAGRDGIPINGKTKKYRRQVELVQRAARAAARVRDAFARANLRLVISIARRYAHGPMDFADLVQEGNMGLLKAIDRFDYSRGFRFSTYASWWIRHSVGRALADKGREVRVPVHMVDATFRIKKAERDLATRLGRGPTQEEIAEEASVPLAKFHQMSHLLLGNPLSMNQPVSNDDERPRVEVFEDPASEEEGPIETLDRATLERELHRSIATLSEIETDVIRRRFALDGEREHTLQEIADGYGRSRERIRQIESAALRKLRLSLAEHKIEAA